MYSNSSGVDVIITIFCDFSKFSAKKFAFFSKTYVMIKILHNLALFWVKNANFFAEFFGENILKNHNIGPRCSSRIIFLKAKKFFKNKSRYWLCYNFYSGGVLIHDRM
jgi:hypothetical protein